MLFVDSALATRLEEAQAWRSVRYARAHEARQPTAGSTVLSVAGGQAVFAAAGSPVNRVIALGMAGPITPAEFDQVEDFYHQRGEPCQVDLCPLADESLLRLLQERHYQIGFLQNVLVCPLPAALPAAGSAGQVAVTRADPEDAERWIDVVARGFSEITPPPAADIAILTPNFYSGACYFAWVAGEIAGGGAMYLHNGVAEFGGASTLVQYRRRGVQRALLYQRLAAAFAAGCDLALVATEPGSASQKNVQRAGFSLAYTKVRMVQVVR